MKLSHLNRTSAKIVHETVNKYMKMAAAELGMTVKPSSARFTAVDFSKKIVLVLGSNPEADKVKEEFALKNFCNYAAIKGFNPSLFGKTLVLGAKKLKVVGYTSKRYKKPIDLLEVATGKMYICTIAHMKLAKVVD